MVCYLLMACYLWLFWWHILWERIQLSLLVNSYLNIFLLSYVCSRHALCPEGKCNYENVLSYNKLPKSPKCLCSKCYYQKQFSTETDVGQKPHHGIFSKLRLSMQIYQKRSPPMPPTTKPENFNIYRKIYFRKTCEYLFLDSYYLVWYFYVSKLLTSYIVKEMLPNQVPNNDPFHYFYVLNCFNNFVLIF